MSNINNETSQKSQKGRPAEEEGEQALYEQALQSFMALRQGLIGIAVMSSPFTDGYIRDKCQLVVLDTQIHES